MFIDNGDVASAPKGSGRFGLNLQATVSNGTPTSGNYLLVDSLVSVNAGAWHFLVATYDGSGQTGGIKLYVDGSAVARPHTRGTLNGLTTLNNVPVTIGLARHGSRRV